MVENPEPSFTPIATSYLLDDSLPPAWVIVAGGIDRYGAMDKANFALARRLLENGRTVHLITHRVADELRREANVQIHLAPTPAGSLLLGEMHLSRLGRKVAATLSKKGIPPIVLSNGGNCSWPGVNWVHSLHHAWPTVDRGAPVAFRVKNRIAKQTAIYREARAIRSARLIVANSHHTKTDIVKWLPDTAGRVETIYLGSDPQAARHTPEARGSTRKGLGIAEGVPVVLFAGALSHDNNKGFDVLLDAWRILGSEPGWNAKLLVAGGGGAVQSWRDSVAVDRTLSQSVKVLGYVTDMSALYASSDLLVAPSRYEAYGLAAHEAICAGLPALISATAGIAERYPPALGEMILQHPSDAFSLAGKLRSWRPNAAAWRDRFAPLRSELASHSWDAMADQLIQLAESRLALGVPTRTPHDKLRTNPDGPLAAS